jgi:amidase
MNGVVGLKPTVVLVPRTGVILISHSQDTPGPIARTVADAVLLLAVMAGTDPDD